MRSIRTAKEWCTHYAHTHILFYICINKLAKCTYETKQCTMLNIASEQRLPNDAGEIILRTNILSSVWLWRRSTENLPEEKFWGTKKCRQILRRSEEWKGRKTPKEMLIEQMCLICKWLFKWKFYFEALTIFKFLKTYLDCS